MNSPASKEYSKETALLTTVHDLINAVTLPTATSSFVEFSWSIHKNHRSCIFCYNLQLHQQNCAPALMNSHWDKSFETIRSFFVHLLEKLASLMNIFNVFLKSISTAISCCWINIDSKWTPQTKEMKCNYREAKSRACLLHSSWISSAWVTIAVGPMSLQCSWHSTTTHLLNM